MTAAATTTVDGARGAAIARVAAYISDHPEAAHAHQDLADLAAMNRRAFAARFLLVMGVSVKAFVRTVRVAHARYLLDETELSVTQVMRRSGFASTDAGRRAFVLLEQVAPIHYRTRLRPSGEE